MQGLQVEKEPRRKTIQDRQLSAGRSVSALAMRGSPKIPFDEGQMHAEQWADPQFPKFSAASF